MFRSLKLVVLAGVLLALAASGIDPAGAGGGGASRGRAREKPDFEAPGGVLVPVPGGPSLPGSNATVCTAPNGVTGPITHAPPPESQEHYQQHAAQYYGPAAGMAGTWHLRFCGGVEDQIVFVPGEGPSLALLEDIAEASVGDPEIHMSPSEERRQLVNLTTWLWVDDAPWQPVTVRNDDNPGLVIELTAVAQKVEWDVGDGTKPFECSQGRPYDPNVPDDEQQPTCAHIYRKSSAGTANGTFRVRATVMWTATYTVNGQPPPPTAPVLQPAYKTSYRSVTVAERQALNG